MPLRIVAVRDKPMNTPSSWKAKTATGGRATR